MNQQKPGPKPKFDENTTPLLAKWMARAGHTDAQVAAELGVSPGTFYRWARKYPQLREAMRETRDFVDNLVEDSLLKRALGFEYTEQEVDLDPATRQARAVRTRKKAMAPDTTAAIFWLKNRRPDKWRDVHKLEGELRVAQVKDAVQEVMGDAQLHESLLEIGRRFDFTRSTDASPD